MPRTTTSAPDHQGFRTITNTNKQRSSTSGNASVSSVHRPTPFATGSRGGGAKQLAPSARSGNRSAYAHGASSGARLHKLDESSASTKHAKVSREFREAMQRERLARKWTQKALAQRINEKPQVVHQYESGQAIPNGAIVQKLNRALGGRLPKAK